MFHKLVDFMAVQPVEKVGNALKEQKRLTIEDCFSYIDQHVFPLTNPHKLRPKTKGFVGIEIEMIPMVLPSPHEALLPVEERKMKVERALEKLAKEKAWEAVYEESSQGKILLVLKISKGETLTFEPGGQMEYSSQPFQCLDESFARIESIQSLLKEKLSEENFDLLQIGVEPWHTLDEIGLRVYKKRYIAMNEYFQRNSLPIAPEMMRQTASIQVSLDFGHEEVQLAKRYLYAQVLAPFVAAIFANSPFHNGQKTDFLSYRTEIWRHVDPFRTGFVGLEKIAHSLTRRACVESYLEYALSCPIVYVERLGYAVPEKALTMRDFINRGYQGVFPSLEDFIGHLSLLFPEARPRGYIELRCFDAQSPVWQFAPAAFVVGLFYDEKNLEWISQNFEGSIHQTEKNMKEATNGLLSEDFKKVAKQLMEKSLEGLQRLEGTYCGEKSLKILRAFDKRFTSRGLCPANDLIDAVEKKGRSVILREDIRNIEEEWNLFISKEG